MLHGCPATAPHAQMHSLRERQWSATVLEQDLDVVMSTYEMVPRSL